MAGYSGTPLPQKLGIREGHQVALVDAPRRAKRPPLLDVIVPTDITEQTIRDLALPTGLVDNKVCAIDDTWSALRLVIRKEHRSQAT